MNEAQIFRALDAIHDALVALAYISAEVVDCEDGRLASVENATKKLHEILYVEQDQEND